MYSSIYFTKGTKEREKIWKEKKLDRGASFRSTLRFWEFKQFFFNNLKFDGKKRKKNIFVALHFMKC